MNIPKISLLLVIVYQGLIATGCKTAKEVSGPIPQTRQLCGTFICESSLFDTLIFTDWNTVEMMTTFIPPSDYFIKGDTLVVLPDKSFLMYRIVDDNTLIGFGGWTQQDTMRRLQLPGIECKPTHLLSSEQV